MLPPAFTNTDIIAGLAYEHTTVEAMVVQKLDERNTLLVFAEGEDIEKLCSTLQCIEMWFGHSVNTGCDVATFEQMMMGDQLYWVGREESASVEGTNMQLPRPMPEPQHNISCLSVASQVVGKMSKFSTFSRDSAKKGGVSFEQWPFEVRSMMQSYLDATLRGGIV